MAKIAIVTDSTAACTEEMIGNVPIISVPLDVVWGERPLCDGVDVSAGDFYEEMKLAEVLPTTSQPSPSAFQEAYRNLLINGYEVLSIHISEGISGTINAARQAITLLDAQDKVVVVDSLVTAMVLKMQIIEAAKAANNGATLKECVAFVQDMRKRCGVFFTVETLDYLERGGRMTRGEAFMGNLLKIHPILTFVDGKIVSIQKVRTHKSALRTLKKLFFEAVEGKTIRNISATYTDNQTFVEEFINEVIAELGIERPVDAFIDQLTPVIGTHTGPGCVGLAYLVE